MHHSIPIVYHAENLGYTEPPAAVAEGSMFILSADTLNGGWSSFDPGDVVTKTDYLGWHRVQPPAFANVEGILPSVNAAQLCVFEPGVGRYALFSAPPESAEPVAIHRPGAGACAFVTLDATLAGTPPTATVTLPAALTGTQVLQAWSLTGDALLGYPAADQISVTGGNHSKTAQRIAVVVVE